MGSGHSRSEIKFRDNYKTNQKKKKKVVLVGNYGGKGVRERERDRGFWELIGTAEKKGGVGMLLSKKTGEKKEKQT